MDPIHKEKILQENKYLLHWFALIIFVLTSSCTPLVLHAPIKWIAQLSSTLIDSVSSQWDHDISYFERVVFIFVVIELIAELIGIMALWNPAENIGFLAAFVLLLTILIGYVFWVISYLNLKPIKQNS